MRRKRKESIGTLKKKKETILEREERSSSCLGIVNSFRKAWRNFPRWKRLSLCLPRHLNAWHVKRVSGVGLGPSQALKTNPRVEFGRVGLRPKI